MATIQFHSRSTAGRMDRYALAAKPRTHHAPSIRWLARELGHLGQRLLGVMLLLLGSALVLTLWLMPVGLPLALLGVALIAAPRGP